MRTTKIFKLELVADNAYILLLMSRHIRSLLALLGAIGIVFTGIFFLIPSILTSRSDNSPAHATSQSAGAAYTSTDIASSTPNQKKVTLHTPSPQPPVSTSPSTSSEENITTIARIENPYQFPPQSFAMVNNEVRPALVNVLCLSSAPNIRPISGSGIIIDPRGVILTNAHVGQYVLLAQSKKVNLSCSIRSGAPAQAIGGVEVVYLPPLWIDAHASDITSANPMGTGEHDYALLRIVAASEQTFPSIDLDVREAIGFPGDSILAASYPAEFLGSLAALNNLYPVSSVSSIRQLLTFDSNTADLISIGGVIEAQSGSSGGAIVNAWGRLIAVITTTSEGATTADRELRGLTLSYISRDLLTESGFSLSQILGGDIGAQTTKFQTEQAPALVDLLIAQISKRSQ